MTADIETKENNFKIKTNTIIQKYFFYLIFLLIILSFVSCSSPKSAPAISKDAAPISPEEYPAAKAEASRPEPINTAEPLPKLSPITVSVPVDVVLKTTASLPARNSQKNMHMQDTTTDKSISSKDSKPNQFDQYRVVLAADKQMKIPGLPGELRVWIGNPDYQPSIPNDMAEANTTIRAGGGWAKIEPHAQAFKLEPSITPCVKIDPSGSEVRFNLIPKKAGTFKVGATVYLFNSSNCEEAPIPKIATDLYVTVNVDKKVIVQEKGKELWTVFWEQLLEFWEAFLILLFGLILFLIRGKLKRWFGYEKN